MKDRSLLDARPIFALTRNRVPEIVVHGFVLQRVEGKDLAGTGTDSLFVARSLLKPWQFLTAGVAENEEHWVMGVASHSGQPRHQKAITALSETVGFGEEDLFCPRVFPLDPQVAAEMRLAGEKPHRLYHPCSGKHLLMLAACRKNDFPVDLYWQTDHPLQKKLSSFVGGQAGEKHSWVTDSCGVPTLAASGRVHLTLWERLSISDQPEQVFLKELWIRNPKLVGGSKRLDSDLLEFGAGKLLAKEGADGILMVQSLPGFGEPVSGCLVKLSGGYNPAYLALALWCFLSANPSLLTPTYLKLADYLRSRLEEWVPRDQKLVNLLSETL